MSDNINFAKLVERNRSQIIKTWSYLSNDSQARAANTLTQHAIEHHFIQSRDPVKGATLASWSIHNTAPLWACKSALLLSLERNWKPKSKSEWAVFSALFIKIENSVDIQHLMSQLPDGFEQPEALRWLEMAIEDKINFVPRGKQ